VNARFQVPSTRIHRFHLLYLQMETRKLSGHIFRLELIMS